VEFRILGPLEVRENGATANLGHAKQRTVLGVLLLHPNQVVSTDRLIDELWGEEPPASATKLVQLYISHLRKHVREAGFDDILHTQAPGYLAKIERDNLDAARFQHLVEEARRLRRANGPDQATTLYREALELWRGSALADLSFEASSRHEVERLNEARLEALSERIDCDLELGRHAELIGELEGLVAAYPLREGLRSQLMLALYRSGRQAEALATYQEMRRALSEELGLEPSPDVRQLEQAILRQEPELDLVPPTRPPSLTHDGEVRRQGHPRRAPWVLVLGSLVALGLGGAAMAVLLATREDAGLPEVAANAVGIVDADSGRIIDQLPIDTGPSGLAVGNGVWATSFSGNSVWRLAPRTRTIRQTIPVGSGPSGIAVGNHAVWVSNKLDGTVSRIDQKTNRVVDRIHVGTAPTAIAFGAGSVWVASSADGTISRIDPETDRVTKTIDLGAASPTDVVAGPRSVWVTSERSQAVLEIPVNGTTVRRPIRLSGPPTSAARSGRFLWVTSPVDGTVSRIDLRGQEGPETKPLGGAPSSIAARNGQIWVANESSNVLEQLDPRTVDVVRTIKLHSAPNGIVVVGNRIWVSTGASSSQHRGGVVRGIVPAQASSLDPALDLSALRVVAATNDGLTTFAKRGAEGRLVPDLATSLPEPTDNGRTYTFTLRRGVRYSTGSVVRASDFRYSLERLFRVHSPAVPVYYEHIAGARACEARPARCNLSSGVVADDVAGTVSIHLTQPDPDILYKLALFPAVVFPHGSLGRRAAQGSYPATGPYVIAPRVPGDRVTLVRNPFFKQWSVAAQPAGFPDEIDLEFGLPNADKMIKAVEDGRADFMLAIPVGRLHELRTQYASQLHVSSQPTTRWLDLNTRIAPFDDVRVRRALNFAVDRRLFIERFGGPMVGRPTCQILPPNFPGYAPFCRYTAHAGRTTQWLAPDMARARQLIKMSGTGGSHVTVWSDGPGLFLGMRYVVSLLRQLGYRTSLRVIEDGNRMVELAGDSRNKAQVVGIDGWLGDYPAGSDFFEPNFSCDAFVPKSQSNSNLSEFCSPRIDSQMRHAATLQATHPRSAARLWASIDRQVVDEAPAVPLFTQNLVQLVSARVRNYTTNPSWGLLIDQLWVR